MPLYDDLKEFTAMELELALTKRGVTAESDLERKLSILGKLRVILMRHNPDKSQWNRMVREVITDKQQKPSRETTVVPETCELCGEPLFDDRLVVLLEGCEHLFHQECFVDLETEDCPICGKTVGEVFSGDSIDQLRRRIPPTFEVGPPIMEPRYHYRATFRRVALGYPIPEKPALPTVDIKIWFQPDLSWLRAGKLDEKEKSQLIERFRGYFDEVVKVILPQMKKVLDKFFKKSRVEREDGMAILEKDGATVNVFPTGSLGSEAGWMTEASFNLGRSRGNRRNRIEEIHLFAMRQDPNGGGYSLYSPWLD
jgi:hypothetical protein